MACSALAISAGAPRFVQQAASEMQRYVEQIPHSSAQFAMQPIPGGTFLLGSPADEAGRKKDEGPQRRVQVEPFWMGEREVTWDEFRVFQFRLDQQRRAERNLEADERAARADAVSHPTKPYVPMDFGMGFDGFPASSMTHFAARHYTKWLSATTGRFYRLPTEAEWEYACRAGSTSAYSFGDDAAALGESAWTFDNSGEVYHKVGTKKPNAFGLHDMHGNVAEWVLDRYDAGFYGTLSDAVNTDVLNASNAAWPHVVRGGSFDSDPDRLRCAARRASQASWQAKDPQQPRSIWYLTNAAFVGLRVVRPLREPTARERELAFEPYDDETRRVLERQRQGAR